MSDSGDLNEGLLADVPAETLMLSDLSDDKPEGIRRPKPKRSQFGWRKIPTIRRLYLRSVDSMITFRSVLIFLHVLTSILLMVYSLELCWDPIEMVCNTSQPWVVRIDACINVSTFVLVWQVIDRKSLQLWAHHCRRFGSHQRHWTDTFRLLSCHPRRAFFGRYIWLQIIVLLITQPAPLMEKFGVPQEWTLVMYVRSYLFLRMFRDFSTSWRQRDVIFKMVRSTGISLQHHKQTVRTVRFSLRMWTSRQPVLFCILVFSVSTFVFGHCIYVSERVVQPEFTYPVSCWLALQTLLTWYANDSFGYLYPSRYSTMCFCLLSCMVGLFMVSFVVAIGYDRCFPNETEKHLVNVLMWHEASEEVSENAARVIQYAWRNRRELRSRTQSSRLILAKLFGCIRRFRTIQRSANELKALIASTTANELKTNELKALQGTRDGGREGRGGRGRTREDKRIRSRSITNRGSSRERREDVERRERRGSGRRGSRDASVVHRPSVLTFQEMSEAVVKLQQSHELIIRQLAAICEKLQVDQTTLTVG